MRTGEVIRGAREWRTTMADWSGRADRTTRARGTDPASGGEAPVSSETNATELFILDVSKLGGTDMLA